MNDSRPLISYPLPPIGVNNDPATLLAACPSRHYQQCFARELRLRYPVTKFKKRHRPFRCYGSSRSSSDNTECKPLSLDEVPKVDRKSKDSASIRLCDRSPPPPPLPPERRLRCDSDPAAVQARAVLLLGVPSSPNVKGRQRRDAIRASWMQDERVGSDVVVCFLLSAEAPPKVEGSGGKKSFLEALRAERAEHGDVLLVDAPETPWIIHQPTRYSGGTKRGRGMPTFKQV